MKDKRKFERHEYMYGPHFNEECALKAVSKMQNEDGTTGQHWTLTDTTSVASKYGISFDPHKYNKYDWYVALNMVYSDYYKLVMGAFHTADVKYFVELAKYWLDDKDIEEGKMWYYYKYVMNTTYHDIEDDEDEDVDDYEDYDYSRKSRRMDIYRRPYSSRYEYDEEDYPVEKEYDYRRSPMHERIGSRY